MGVRWTARMETTAPAGPGARSVEITAVRKNRRVMTADGCLGLALMYLSSKSELKYIGLLFGINEVRARSYCRLGMKLLNKVHWSARCVMSSFASALTLSPWILVLYSLCA